MLAAASPAHADPISVTVLAILGTTTATALAVAVTTFVLTTLASLAISFAMTKLFGPKQNAQDRQASVLSISIGENPREALLGEVATGGSLADAFNYGGKDGTDWEVLIVVVADHRCHSLTGLYVGDVYVPFAGDGAVAGYNGQLEVYWRNGTEDQVLPSVVTSYGGWSASDNLSGLATIVVAYKADAPDAKNPIWTAGRPSFLWIVKGALLYLPRKDSSIGGSGPHRWDDPSTREWSDNLIDCRYNWVRGIYACDRIDQPGMLLVGRGLSAIEAPPEDIIAFANTCDEPVALKAGGTEPRYRCNLVVRSNEDYISTEETFAAACGGIIIQRQGGVQVEPGSARSVVAEITDADLIVGEKVTVNKFRPDTQRINSVVPRYVEPAQRWADHAAPLRRKLADLIEDGGPREESLSLVAVTSGTQAQRCGEIKRRMARLERSATLTLGPRFAHLEEGDWIAWTSVRHFGGERVVFRIGSYNLAQSWRNTLTLDEIAAECFGWDRFIDELTPGAVAEQQTPPTLSTPDAADWALTGSIVSGPTGSSVPALIIEGSLNGDYAASILIEYRLVPVLQAEGGTPILNEPASPMLGEGDAGSWVAAPTFAPDTEYAVISPVVDKGAYEAAVSYRGERGTTGRLILGPVVAGSLAVARGALQITGLDPEFPVSSDASHIYVVAFTATIDAMTMQFPAGTIGGLAASTRYSVFWRISTATYEVASYPALAQKASSDLVFIENHSTLDTLGAAPPPTTAPPGYGGTGPRELVNLS